MNTKDLNDITGDWNYRELPKNIYIGQSCWLERKDSFSRFRSQLTPGLVLGDRARVYTWTTFNVEPTGFVVVGEDSTLVGATFMCQELIKVGSRVIVSYHVTIADSDFHPTDSAQRKQDAIANSPFGNRSQRPAVISRPVVIEDDVWIGIGAIILKGVHIGQGARINAGAVITADIPAGAIVFGNPATILSGDAAR